MKKLLKVVFTILFVLALGYMSQWDVPKETRTDIELEHKKEIEAYLEARAQRWERWAGPLPQEALIDD